jgi:phage tail P2-like protein
MAGMKISDLDFLRLLPAFMRDDEAVIALSKAMNELLGPPAGRVKTIRTWDKIDELNEAECDEMAWEQDIDWYDSSMSLEEKRAPIKMAQQIKRKRGTKWAVERLITAYFGEGYVVEWYEMDDGDPYTFVVLTTNAAITEENFNKFVEAAEAAKNERSHIAGVYYFWPQGPDPGIEYALGSKAYTYNCTKCGTKPRTATLGFIVKQSIETEPELLPYLYNFTHTGEHLCGTYPRPGTLGAAVKGTIEAAGTEDAIQYDFKRQAGTYPRTATLGVSEKHATTTATTITFAAYSFVKCGTRRCGE